MSFARRVRRNRQAEEEKAIAIGAAVRGCRCDYQVERRHVDGHRWAMVRHDDGCPAIDSGVQLAIMPGRHQSQEEFGRLVAELVREIEGGTL